VGVGQGALGENLMTPSFWKGRRVLLTGHTGFKGAWAAAMLSGWGADVTGAALPAETDPNLWLLIRDRVSIREIEVDLRDTAATAAIFSACRPEIVFHMAAQAQVRSSYSDPVGTFASNVMGTVNLLDALRGVSGVKTVLVTTSDKVYANPEDGTLFNETSALGGSDPYSASKAACEIVVKSFAESFFIPAGVPLATARGGNVIGGGDFSSDRLVPDLYRAALAGAAVELRYPGAHRPWQHVLDCLSGYFTYLEHLSAQKTAGPATLNFGPSSEEIFSVAQVADAVGARLGNAHPWEQAQGKFAPEKQALRLTAALAAKKLGWHPRLDLATTIDWTADWYARFVRREDPLALVQAQIAAFSALG
jgi:CDP-glucose 4,6-dehydratase